MYIHTYTCNAQNCIGVFTPVKNHRPSLPSQMVPVDFLPICPDVTKHHSVTQTCFLVIICCGFSHSGAVITHSCINKDN